MQKLTHSYYCGTSSTQIIYETIGAYFDGICAAFPENDALVVRHQGIRWSYREFQTKVDALAAGLIALGIEPGDRGSGDPTVPNGWWCS